MAFDRSQVKHLAQLAGLHVSAAEMDAVSARITDILHLIDQMQTVDTDAVLPLAHPLEIKQRLRPDRITETNQRETMLALAPATDSGLYLVPRVVE